jgi:hypothetical protein
LPVNAIFAATVMVVVGGLQYRLIGQGLESFSQEGAFRN